MTTRHRHSVLVVACVLVACDRAEIVLVAKRESFERPIFIVACDDDGSRCAATLMIECPSREPACERSIGIFVADSTRHLQIQIRPAPAPLAMVFPCEALYIDLDRDDTELSVVVDGAGAAPDVRLEDCDGCAPPRECTPPP